jgi:hypothetical protein
MPLVHPRRTNDDHLSILRGGEMGQHADSLGSFEREPEIAVDLDEVVEQLRAVGGPICIGVASEAVPDQEVIG